MINSKERLDDFIFLLNHIGFSVLEINNTFFIILKNNGYIKPTVDDNIHYVTGKLLTQKVLDKLGNINISVDYLSESMSFQADVEKITSQIEKAITVKREYVGNYNAIVYSPVN